MDLTIDVESFSVISVLKSVDSINAFTGIMSVCHNSNLEYRYILNISLEYFPPIFSITENLRIAAIKKHTICNM